MFERIDNRIRVLFALALALILCAACSSASRRGRASRPSPSRGDEVSYKPRGIKPSRLSKSMRARCEEYAPIIERTAQTHGLEPALVMAVVRVESGFNPKARSGVGARGLMQVMPRTGMWLKCRDLYDAEDNLECGARVLVRYLKRFKGHLVYGLAAYNAGPGNVKTAYREHRLPFNFGYVEKVLKARAYFRRHGCGG